jgi:hypothetical protein
MAGPGEDKLVKEAEAGQGQDPPAATSLDLRHHAAGLALQAELIYVSSRAVSAAHPSHVTHVPSWLRRFRYPNQSHALGIEPLYVAVTSVDNSSFLF